MSHYHLAAILNRPSTGFNISHLLQTVLKKKQPFNQLINPLKGLKRQKEVQDQESQGDSKPSPKGIHIAH